MGILALLLSTAIWALQAWLNSRKAAARSRHWRAAAKEAGVTELKRVDERGTGRTVLRGRSGSMKVDMGWEADGDKAVLWAAVQRVLPGMVLVIQAAARTTAIGDPDFDEAIDAHGPDAALRAVLDEETRGLVKDWLLGPSAWPSAGRSVANGELRLELPDTVRQGVPETLAAALREALELAPRLVRPEDVPARLGQSVRAESHPGVRLGSALALIRDYPDHPATRDAVATARADASDEVRLGVALALGPAGLDLLRALLEAEDPDDGCAAQALVALGAALPAERVRTLLQASLRRRRLRTAEACLAWLGWHGGAEAVEPLARVLAIEHGDLAAAAATALGASGLPEAEAPLIRALDRDVDAARVAAAEALEDIGSAAAVWPLKEAATRHAAQHAFVAAARQAVAAIQSRLTGSAGELSLAGAEAGQLDLAPEDAAGRLSLAPAGQPKTSD